VVVAAVGSFAANTQYEVSQHDRKFSVKKLSVQKGATVNFRNLDPFFHNVFSVTPGSEFDLGAYPQGESKPVTFSKPGTVEVECALHPEMKMTIEVSE
jgi:plastocyanin